MQNLMYGNELWGGTVDLPGDWGVITVQEYPTNYPIGYPSSGYPYPGSPGYPYPYGTLSGINWGVILIIALLALVVWKVLK